MEVVKEKVNFSEYQLGMVKREQIAFWKKLLIAATVVLVSLYMGIKNYLFFHSLIEMMGIFVGFGVAIAVYHSCKIMKNGLYIYLGVMFLFTSLIQIIHFFSYAGVSIFALNSYNLTIQISIVGKYLDAVSMLLMLVIPTAIIKNNLGMKKLVIPYVTITSFLLISIIYLRIFPVCALDNAESTTFKVASEYILLFTYAFLLFILSIKKRHFNEKLFNYIFSYISLRLLAEILFASSDNVTDIGTILAHILRFLAFCVIYKAVSIGVISKPISILFDELGRKNRELKQKTIELEAANRQLKLEVEEGMRIEELLRKSEERYRMLLEFMPDAVILHDRENVFFVNHSGIRLYGFEDKQQIIDKTILELFGEKNYSTYLTRMDEVDKSDFPIIFEQIVLHNDERIYTEVITTAYNMEEKSAFLSVIRDITQRKQFEDMKKSVDESKRLLEEATEMDRLRTDYVTNLSHEFRTPLSIMLCTLKIMESIYKSESNMTADKEKISRYITSMKNNSYRLLRTANNLLEIKKIESGCDQLRLQNCNIVRIVEKVTMSVWEYTRNRRISLMFDTDIEEIITACDIDKIERIMLNLLSNAIKFTREDGHIEVNIYDQKNYILITVSDTGIGIPEDKFELIFERFKQVDNSLTRDHEGTGIGLALVMSLVKMHDGKIEVESKVGVGSTFRIFLPVRVMYGETCLDDNETEAEIDRSIDEKINIELSNI